MDQDQRTLLESIADDDAKAVREWLDEHRDDVDLDGVADADGNSVLHVAVMHGATNVARVLLKAGCDVDKRNALGETALLVAARRGDLPSVQLLLDYGADKRIEDANGRTPFFVAMRASHSRVAAALLPGDSPVAEDETEAHLFGRTEAESNNARSFTETNRTELARRRDEQHLRDAAEAGDLVSVKGVLELAPEIDLDAMDDQGHTALYGATFFGRTQVVEYLLKQGADADVSDMDGKTPLHVAASRGYSRIMRALVQYTNDIDAQDLLGATATFSAAESGSAEVLRILMENSADPNIANSNEETPLWAATANGHESSARVLLEGSSARGKTKVEVDARAVERGRTPLHVAAERGDINIARLLLEHGAGKEVRDATGNTALFVAADGGHARMVMWLLERNVVIDAANHHGETPLYVSSLDGHVPVTEVLLNRGADTEAADDNGETPLMGAAQEGHTAIITELLAASAKIEAANDIGETPLMVAALEGFQNAVALLINNGADFGVARNDGKTALHLAAMDGHKGVMNVILAAARLEFQQTSEDMEQPVFLTTPLHLATDTRGETALHVAARVGQVSAMQLMLEYDDYFHEQLQGATFFGRLVDVPNRFGWTALHAAVDGAHHGAVALLLRHKADVNTADIFENTPVHLAARGIDHRILHDLLAEKGVSVDAVNVKGRTALHFASACVRPSAVTSLLNHGADALAADKFKMEPIDVLGNVDVCTPEEATRKGLCDQERKHFDMCPVSLGDKNELLETRVVLQFATEKQNRTKPCLKPCQEFLAAGVGHQGGNKMKIVEGSKGSPGSPSITVPLYGAIIPFCAILLLAAVALCYFLRKRTKESGQGSQIRRSGLLRSVRRFKQKQTQPQSGELQRMEGSRRIFRPVVSRTSTFDIVRSILADGRQGHNVTRSSDSDSSESCSSCGWSDASEDVRSVKKRDVQLVASSSGEHQWHGHRIQVPHLSGHLSQSHHPRSESK